MNISICRRYLLAFSMLMSIITPSAAIGNAQPTKKDDYQDLLSNQEIHNMYQEALEPCFTRALAQIHLIDCMLQDLAFNLANNNSITTKNRAQTIVKIRAFRELLSELKDTRIVVLNEQLVNSFIVITRTAISNLTNALRRGLDSLQVIDINTIPLETKKGISLQDIERELSRNDVSIKALVKLSDNLGLHWYNKMYRGFKHLLVDPAKAVAPYALVGGTLTASALMAWYYCGGENPKWLRDKMGWPQFSDYAEQSDEKTTSKLNELKQAIFKFLTTRHIDEDVIQELREGLPIEPVIQSKPIGFLGRIEQFLFRLKNERHIIGSSILLGGKTVIDYLAPAFKRSLINKIKATDNFLMGGTYRNRPVDEYTYASDVTFDNLIGQEDAKEYGRELCQYLRNPELFDRTKIAPSTGILLFGDTRTGKSYYISALFGEIQKTLGAEGAAFKMIKVSFDDILKLGIDRIMELARNEAPIIVVIEEIDLLGLQRTNNAQRLAEFMTAMSSCLQENTLDKTVIVIGTTNKLENLEPALRETGRFGKHIYFDYPKFNERKLFIEHELVKTACNLKNFDIDKLARDTEGCSFEKLALFIKRAFLRAKLYNETVCQEALERSIDENIRGISACEVTLDQEQKQLVAAHMAGHVVASILLNPHQKISKVTLCDVANKIDEQLVGMSVVYKNAKQDAMEHGKIFANYDHDMPGIEGRDEKLKQCKITLAGHIAETLLLGSCGYGYHPHDKQAALDIAKSIACGNLDLATLPNKIRNQYYDAAFELMNSCEKEVTALLEEHRNELVAVMNELVAKLTLDAHQLRKLILGEQASDEQLDASSLLAKLLKDQPELELDEESCIEPIEPVVTATA